jgi:exopolysaccharide biosynthesis polyprenyl glycosylphosphotransferase
MQSDLDSEVSTISSRSLYSAQGVLVKSENLSSSLTDLISVQPGLRGQKRPSSAVWSIILMLGDVALFIALFGLVLFFHLIPQLSANTLEIREMKLIWICLALVCWGLAVNMTQSQNMSYASNRFKGPCCTLFALVLMCIFWMILSYFLLNFRFIALVSFELFFLGLAIPIFTLWRFLFAEVRGLPRFRLRAVIVGINSAGETVAEELQAAKHSSINILGYIDESIEEKSYNELPVLGGRSALRYLVYNNMVDMIIIALKYGTNLDLLKEATDAAQHGISVLPMAVVFENSTGKIPVEHVGDQWYVALQSERILSPFYLCGKKVLDLVCGIFGLLVLCLVFPIVALCIYLDSPGPIFYSQERVGLRGKPFRIYKFRTMRTDAEAGGHAMWAAASDKRITRVGRFLRSTHLDEIPQVFNILRGDMSLIGPRPERAEFIKALEKTIPFYGYRQAVKPGLTGWAQVKYRYGRTDNDALIKLQYDLYYIKRQSFMLDLFIILKTVGEVLSLRGA